MLVIGEIVHANVTRVEVYGIYLDCRGDVVLVLIPNLSWTRRVQSCRDFAAAGDHFDVKILSFSTHEGIYVGSIKHAHPEDDPWESASWLTVGTQCEGRVYVVMKSNSDPSVPFAYAITLEPGIEAILRFDPRQPRLKEGDAVQVRIESVDRERREVSVSQASS